MPMNYTDDVVRQFTDRLGIKGTIAERREALALRSEREYNDYVDAWEIRNQRPWTSMSREEAMRLVEQHPDAAVAGIMAIINS